MAPTPTLTAIIVRVTDAICAMAIIPAPGSKSRPSTRADGKRLQKSYESGSGKILAKEAIGRERTGVWGVFQRAGYSPCPIDRRYRARLCDASRALFLFARQVREPRAFESEPLKASKPWKKNGPARPARS